ncbi:hypothetical protein GCWU000341_00569 [Oribacterium sp. oral taxon 078 str. F0262]|nr:hypothetical protein GCWU000341_00569 [Oribacterium sp. oral taxon 078 str. F0262]
MAYKGLLKNLYRTGTARSLCCHQYGNGAVDPEPFSGRFAYN